jgi:hypothetical protein
MATTAKIAKDLKKTEIQMPPPQTGAGAAGGPVAICANSRFAGCAFRQLALNGEIPGVTQV